MIKAVYYKYYSDCVDDAIYAPDKSGISLFRLLFDSQKNEGILSILPVYTSSDPYQCASVEQQSFIRSLANDNGGITELNTITWKISDQIDFQ